MNFDSSDNRAGHALECRALAPQVLDIDLSGMPCGKKAALATKGYFANQRNRRGRQLGRVLASRYAEKVRKYGMKRMVRDIFHISGFVVRNAYGRIVQIVLNEQAPLVRGLSRSLDVLLRRQLIDVNWGQTYIGCIYPDRCDRTRPGSPSRVR